MSEQNRTEEGHDCLLWIDALMPEEKAAIDQRIGLAFENAQTVGNVGEEDVAMRKANLNPLEGLSDTNAVEITAGDADKPNQIFLQSKDLHQYPYLLYRVATWHTGYLEENFVRDLIADHIQHESRHAEVAKQVGLLYEVGVTIKVDENDMYHMTPAVRLQGTCSLGDLKRVFSAPEQPSPTDRLVMDLPTK